MNENPRVTELRAIPDPIARAAACQTFVVNGRSTIRIVEGLRDDSIREARNVVPRPTVDALTRQVSAGRSVVVNALRVKT